MAHIRDVRRLSATALALTFLLGLWYLFLRLQAAGSFEWFLPKRGLEAMTLDAWTVLVVALLVFAAFVAATLIYAIPVDKQSGRAIGALRQVQCQNCKAVFRITDDGRRPLTHNCPSCKAYGVYDPTLGPIGEPPVPEDLRTVKRLELTCKSCAHVFKTVDTGARPLRIECPKCEGQGTIR